MVSEIWVLEFWNSFCHKHEGDVANVSMDCSVDIKSKRFVHFRDFRLFRTSQ